jgi:hypothetical protein
MNERRMKKSPAGEVMRAENQESAAIAALVFL